MDKERRLQQLVDVLNEYVQFLNLYSKVKVEQITLTKINLTKERMWKDAYGIDHSETILNVKEIEPTSYLRVTYYEPKSATAEGNEFQSIEFPEEDLDKRLEHYRNKVKYVKEKLEITK